MLFLNFFLWSFPIFTYENILKNSQKYHFRHINVTMISNFQLLFLQKAVSVIGLISRFLAAVL